MKKYSEDFFEKRHQKTIYSAQTIISYLLNIVPNISSAIDVGCGVGTWLSVLKKNGVQEIFGIDGEWIDKKLLVIPSECFMEADLTKSIDLNRRFDLAMSLEVAEHLPSTRAETFVHSLVCLADIVLFSAAIPGQEARDHVNEQWPGYWVELFSKFEYEVFDILRHRFWNDKEILVWYRQNILLFVKRSKISDFSNLQTEFQIPKRNPLSIVHPELFERKIEKYTSVKGSWKAFRRSLKAKLLKSCTFYTQICSR